MSVPTRDQSIENPHFTRRRDTRRPLILCLGVIFGLAFTESVISPTKRFYVLLSRLNNTTCDMAEMNRLPLQIVAIISEFDIFPDTSKIQGPHSKWPAKECGRAEPSQLPTYASYFRSHRLLYTLAGREQWGAVVGWHGHRERRDFLDGLAGNSLHTFLHDTWGTKKKENNRIEINVPK